MDEKKEAELAANGMAQAEPVAAPIDIPPAAVAAPVKRVPKVPVKLTKEETLQVDNFALHLENIAHRKNVIQQTIAQINQEEQETQKALTDFKQELGAKYGMDPLWLKVRKDGMLIEDAPPTMMRQPVPQGPQS